jgi:PAS domain S-box-containing protein
MTSEANLLHDGIADRVERTAMKFDLGRVLDALPALVWTALPDGYIDYVSQRWSDYTGLSPDEAHGWEWQTAVNPDDLPQLLERWRSILASGEPGEMEARVRRFDGQYRCFLVQCSPMCDDAGRILKWYGINTDIDDRKRAEEALRESERSSRSIIDGIPGLVAVFTAGGELELVNHQVLEYYGKTLEELKRCGTSDLVHPEDLPRAIEVFTRSLGSGDPFELEVRARRFDGVYRWLQSRGFPLKDTNGCIVRWYNLLIDIDERMRAEEALRASETNLRRIIDSIPGLVCTMNAAGEVELLSRQVLEYFGKTSEELKGWQFIDAVHPEDLPRVLEAFTHSVTSGNPYDIEHRCRRFDSVYRWFQVRALPVRDADGRITGWYVVLVDIDERKRAEAALQAAHDRLARASQVASLVELSASIAHEVNQPIAAALANAQAALRWLRREPPDLSEVREALDSVVKDGTRAGNVIDRIRSLFKNAPPSLENLDIAEVLSEVVALSRGKALKNRVSLQVQLSEGLPTVRGDRVQLQQVMLNLITNAIEAMSDVDDGNRDLRITAGRDDDDVFITVQDSGPGLTQAALERVFEPFYTTKPTGLGVGLSICHSIIKAHSGALWATNADKGGTVFSFTLPISTSANSGISVQHPVMASQAPQSLADIIS